MAENRLLKNVMERVRTGRRKGRSGKTEDEAKQINKKV